LAGVYAPAFSFPLLVIPEAREGDAGDLGEPRELGEGGVDVVGWRDADVKLVAGALPVYLRVDGADGDDVAPEDLERVPGPAAGFLRVSSSPAESRRSG
jgi:hypothetical protein